MKASKKSSDDSERRLAPGRTADEITNQNISLAVDLARKQLAEGTASPLVISHYLKLGSPTSRLEKEKMELENELLKAKTEALQSAKETEEIYREAMRAFSSYSGNETGGSDVKTYEDQ